MNDDDEVNDETVPGQRAGFAPRVDRTTTALPASSSSVKQTSSVQLTLPAGVSAAAVARNPAIAAYLRSLEPQYYGDEANGRLADVLLQRQQQQALRRRMKLLARQSGGAVSLGTQAAFSLVTPRREASRTIAFETYSSYGELAAVFGRLLQAAEPGSVVDEGHATDLVIETFLQGHPFALDKVQQASQAPGGASYTRFAPVLSLDDVDVAQYRIKVDYHPYFTDTKCFFLCRNGGSHVDFSYHKCLFTLFPAGVSRATFLTDVRAFEKKPNVLLFWQVEPHVMFPQRAATNSQQRPADEHSDEEPSEHQLPDWLRPESLETSAKRARTSRYSTQSSAASSSPILSTQSTLTQSTLTQSTLTQSTLTQSTLTQSTLTQSTLTQSTLTQSTLPQSTLPQSTLTHSTLTQTTLPQSTLPQSTITLSTSNQTSYDDEPNGPTLKQSVALARRCEMRLRQVFSKVVPPSHIDFNDGCLSGIARFLTPKDRDRALAASRQKHIPVDCEPLDATEEDEWYRRRHQDITDAWLLMRRRSKPPPS